MDIESLKTIIESQREELDEKLKNEKIIAREGLDQVMKFLKYPNILAILGVRRCGKSIFSILLSKKLKKEIGYINFVDDRLLNLKTQDLEKVLQSFYELYGDVELIILDEIQNVFGWELFVNRLRLSKKVIITGSNSKLLSGELATHLTGRHIYFTLHPFSFKEIINFKPNIYSTKDRIKLKKSFFNYINGSSFPEYTRFGKDIIRNIFDDIIIKDCLRRYNIREEKSFRELATYLLSNFSCEFMYSKLSKITKLKDFHTIKNYVNYLKEAYLIIVLERYSHKLKQQIIAPKKIYNIDQGFCNFLSFKISKDKGKLLENIIAIELMRRKSSNLDFEIYYWKNHQQKEVDFVIKRKSKIEQLIQVCWSFEDSDTKKREFDSLIKASEELKCKNLLMITNEKEDLKIINNKKIKIIPAWKWLLENSLVVK